MTVRGSKNSLSKGIFSTVAGNVRILAIIVAVLGTVMALPLFIVWKQVFVTECALRTQALSDSCAAARGEIIRLQYAVETLSRTERIETIARERGLQYPAASHIVFVNQAPPPKNKEPNNVEAFLVLVRRSLAHSRG
ncbi:MAG: hypothetical protein PHC61_19305 [Chitinivibrionales bacterium]|nr:hypothetical protein [Chitinivibrionales bacterium]